jgi:hypothetical protein
MSQMSSKRQKVKEKAKGRKMLLFSTSSFLFAFGRLVGDTGWLSA